MAKVKTGAYNPLPVVPIALVGANVNGKPNYLAVGFVNGVSIKPPIVYVSLNKKHYTPQGIIANGTFSINVPSADYVIETDYCGLVSGKRVDKSGIFTTFYGELETAPMIEEFPITCECRYTGQKLEFDMNIAYFGEVVQVYVNKEVTGAGRELDIFKANPIYYSGLENRYRTLGEDMGPAWRIGRRYQPKENALKSETAEPKYQCDISDRPAQPVLSIKTRVSPAALPVTIGESLLAISRYAEEKGYLPAGSPFVAYHGFDPLESDIEIGIPFAPGIKGKDRIDVSEIPSGKAAVYRHEGPYDHLPEVRAGLYQWLQNNGLAITGVTYEIYLNDPRTTAPAKLETEIVFPLKS